VIQKGQKAAHKAGYAMRISECGVRNEKLEQLNVIKQRKTKKAEYRKQRAEKTKATMLEHPSIRRP
jgi:hypothetical protein